MPSLWLMISLYASPLSSLTVIVGGTPENWLLTPTIRQLPPSVVFGNRMIYALTAFPCVLDSLTCWTSVGTSEPPPEPPLLAPVPLCRSEFAPVPELPPHPKMTARTIPAKKKGEKPHHRRFPRSKLVAHKLWVISRLLTRAKRNFSRSRWNFLDP